MENKEKKLSTHTQKNNNNNNNRKDITPNSTELHGYAEASLWTYPPPETLAWPRLAANISSTIFCACKKTTNNICYDLMRKKKKKSK